MKNGSNQVAIRLVPPLETAQAHAAVSKRNPERLLMLDLNDLRDIIFVEDMKFELIYVSPAVTSLFGYTVEEIKGVPKKDFMTPASFALAMENFQKYGALAQAQKDFNPPLMEYEYVRKDGSTFWGELKVNFIRDSEGCLIGSQGILRNIDERKRLEGILHQSNSKFRTIFDLSPQAIALTQMNSGRLIDVNEKFCALTGYRKDEIIGKSTTEIGFYSNENRAKFIEKLREFGEVKWLDMKFLTKEGSTLDAQMFAKTIDLDNEQIIMTIFIDKTHEKKLERQFLQAQKMESIGTIAGSIAHDFNNFLMAIKSYASLMLLDTEKSHPHHPMLSSINQHIENCTQLTQQLLGYARKGSSGRRTSLDLNMLVTDAARSIKGAMEKIVIREELDRELLPVEGDPVQIRQVLYNLYINAADAMPNGGELLIKTSNVSYAAMTGRTYKPKKKEYVSITVSDTGIGMDKGTLDHLFEPFFTTKGPDKGTGLGLASAYGIIKGHAGYIDAESQPGKGTTFFIYLPVAGKKEKAQDLSDAVSIKQEATILLVDDDAIVHEVTSKLLEKKGY